MTKPTRRHTVMYMCDRHAWLNNLTRERRAEFFAEGGPTDGPCAGHGRCAMYAGTDLFVPEVCEEMAEYPLDWPVNQAPREALA